MHLAVADHVAAALDNTSENAVAKDTKDNYDDDDDGDHYNNNYHGYPFGQRFVFVCAIFDAVIVVVIISVTAVVTVAAAFPLSNSHNQPPNKLAKESRIRLV